MSKLINSRTIKLTAKVSDTYFNKNVEYIFIGRRNKSYVVQKDGTTMEIAIPVESLIQDSYIKRTFKI